MKRALLLSIICVFVFSQAQGNEIEKLQNRKFNRPPKVGLVLSGGGAKGSAHIGVLKYLDEIGMPVDYVVGTSMGSIIGALYALGYSSEEMDKLISEQEWSMVMSDKALRQDVSYTDKKQMETFLAAIPFRLYKNIVTESEEITSEKFSLASFTGIIRGQNVYNLLNGLSVGYQDSIDYNKLPIPYACVAVNILDGEEYVMHSGILPLSVRASMAIPGVFAPVPIGDKLLVDGGMRNNYPADVAKEMGADIIIGVEVQSKLIRSEEEIKSLPDILNQLIALMGDAKYVENEAISDILISPDIDDFSTMSFDEKSINRLIENGYNAALEKKDELAALKALMDEWGRKKEYTEAPPALNIKTDSIAISSIDVTGVDEFYIEKILRQTGLKPNRKVLGKDIDRTISFFYGTRAFSSVTYRLLGENEPYRLLIECVPGAPHQVGIGFRFDNEESAAILLNIGINTLKLKGHKLSLTGRLSYNSYGRIDYAYGFSKFPQFNLSFFFKATDMNFFREGEISSNVLYHYNMGELSFSGMNWKQFDVRLGSRIENFNFKRFLSLPDDDFNERMELKNFASVFANMLYDTRDSHYFPTRGNKVAFDFNYYLSGFSSKFSNFGAVQFEYDGVFPLTSRLTISPSVYGRFLIRHSIPGAYVNVMGGSEYGRYLDQQLPFVGINYAQAFQNMVSVAQIDVRQRIWKKHFASAILNVAVDADDLPDFFKEKIHIGAGLKYSYKSLIGPMSLTVHWSNISKKAGAYLNIGYYF